MGRSRKKHDAKAAGTVRALAQYGVPQSHICAVLRENGLADIGVNTLEREYREELDEGKARGDSKLLETAFKIASEGNVTMLCFLLKTRLGMRETKRLEMTSPDGTMSPLDIQVQFVGAKNETETDD